MTTTSSGGMGIAPINGQNIKPLAEIERIWLKIHGCWCISMPNQS